MTSTAIRVLVLTPTENQARIEHLVPTLHALQGLVGGHVEELRLGDQAALFLNEDGKWNNLPLNAAATRLAAATNVGLMPGDYLAGTVFVAGLCGPDGEPDGELHDVPASVLELCATQGIGVNPDTLD